MIVQVDAVDNVSTCQTCPKTQVLCKFASNFAVVSKKEVVSQGREPEIGEFSPPRFLAFTMSGSDGPETTAKLSDVKLAELEVLEVQALWMVRKDRESVGHEVDVLTLSKNLTTKCWPCETSQTSRSARSRCGCQTKSPQGW